MATSHSKQTPWRITELHHASRLWKQGKTLEQLAAELGRTRESIKHQVTARRDLFPRRRQARGDLKDVVEVKMTVPVYTYTLMRKEAADRGISLNMVVREALRDRFVRKLWKPQESTSTAKVKYSNGSAAI